MPNICSDPAVNYLRSQGYMVTRLPKADLGCLQLLIAKGKTLRRLGDITSVFTPGAIALPTIKRDVPAPNVSGKQTADLSLGIGLNILQGLIAALGGSTLAVKASYSHAKSVGFEFSDVTEDNTEVAQLDAFLAAAELNPYSRALKAMLDADDVFVVTAALKSHKVLVEAKKEGKVALDVDVPVLQGAIGGNVKVSAGATGQGKVTYEGAIPLTFGLQAVRLFFENGVYQTLKVGGSGLVVEMAKKAGIDGPILEVPGVLGDL